MQTKQQAEAGAARLLRKLKGTHWKVAIWENLGWHFRAYAPGVTVHRSSVGRGRYWAAMDPLYMFWCVPDTVPPQRDPNNAVRIAIQHAKGVVTELAEIVRKALTYSGQFATLAASEKKAAQGHTKTPRHVAPRGTKRRVRATTRRKGQRR